MLDAGADFDLAVRDHSAHGHLRASLGEVRAAPIDNPERVQFDALHVWSTRVEGAVLLLGLVVVYLTAQQLAVR